MTTVSLTPRAIRFVEEAAADPLFQTDEYEADLALIRGWHVPGASGRPVPLEKLAVPEVVAQAYLTLIIAVLDKMTSGCGFRDWDGNDFGFMESVRETLQTELELQAAPNP